MKVVTRHICPPIPSPCADWIAYFEALDEYSPQGMGRSKDEAINDLLDNTPVDDLVKWFNIETREVDTARGPEHGHWVAQAGVLTVEAPWREQAVADLAAKLIEAA